MQNRRSNEYMLMDVHGAGSQRSDPKSGDPSKFPHGRGPQGDVIRIYNFVRCVRGGVAAPQTKGPKVEMTQASRRRPGPGQDDGTSHRPPAGGRPSRGDFVKRLDRNGDGKVSRTEFDGPPMHFDHLDRNNDGYLSASEAPQGPPPRRRGGK
jgi:hypothetical protein